MGLIGILVLDQAESSYFVTVRRAKLCHAIESSDLIQTVAELRWTRLSLYAAQLLTR